MQVYANPEPDPETSGLAKLHPDLDLFLIQYRFNPDRIIRVRPGPGRVQVKLPSLSKLFILPCAPWLKIHFGSRGSPSCEAFYNKEIDTEHEKDKTTGRDKLESRSLEIGEQLHIIKH